MPDNVLQLERQNAALTLQLLEWLAAAPRTYAEALDTWRSSCPRHTIWEDALAAGLVEEVAATLALTPKGRKALDTAAR